MSSMVDSNMNEIWPTDGKHRITLIYLVEDDGFYGGGYYEPSVDLMGGVGGDSIAEMVNEAYASLERATKAVGTVPFDINDIKKSVKFDLVECRDEYQMDEAHKLLYEGKSFELINKAVFE